MLGMQIVHSKRTTLTEKEQVGFPFDLKYYPSCEQMIPDVDLIMMAVPQTPATLDLINECTIKVCERDVRIVDIGEGSAIDEDVLLRALEDGTWDCELCWDRCV
jgi:lactate dehydrogenase-like 2-hydroxyacid dehydrogenase